MSNEPQKISKEEEKAEAIACIINEYGSRPNSEGLSFNDYIIKHTDFLSELYDKYIPQSESELIRLKEDNERLKEENEELRALKENLRLERNNYMHAFDARVEKERRLLSRIRELERQLEQSNVPRWVKAEERLPDERMWNYVGRWRDGEYWSHFIIHAGKYSILLDGKIFTRENAHRDFEWLDDMPKPLPNLEERDATEDASNSTVGSQTELPDKRQSPDK